jgi:aminoglycoside phosphotransferase (APT) family kinase protein
MAERLKDTIPPREGEELNRAAVHRFLMEQVPDLPEGELEIEQFGAGHSNLTYLLKIGDWEAVLRRPPHGPVAPKAHDMAREYKVLAALHPVFPAVPKPLVYSEDTAIVGSPFFIMERRHGIVLDAAFPVQTKVTTSLCQQISKKMVDTLCDLHRINYRETDLVNIVKPDGFMERQVAGWIGRYKRSETDVVPGVEELMQWLNAHRPKSQEPTVIHYDFKLNNVMFSDDYQRVVGVFDWEMATVGDPLSDLGAAMSYWIQSDDPDLLKKGLGKPPVTVIDGFYTRDEFIQAYAQKSGRDVSQINYYLTFAYFKLAVIVQQIYYRFKKGQTQDPRFSQFNQFVKNLIEYALYQRGIA